MLFVSSLQPIHRYNKTLHYHLRHTNPTNDMFCLYQSHAVRVLTTTVSMLPRLPKFVGIFCRFFVKSSKFARILRLSDKAGCTLAKSIYMVYLHGCVFYLGMFSVFLTGMSYLHIGENSQPQKVYLQQLWELPAGDEKLTTNSVCRNIFSNVQSRSRRSIKYPSLPYCTTPHHQLHTQHTHRFRWNPSIIHQQLTA